MSKQLISTNQAPQAIGTYSQAIRYGNTVYLSGQIPVIPDTMLLVTGDIEAQLRQVFDNMQALTQAAGGGLADLVKITVFLTDINCFPILNLVMADYFTAPYPARAVVGVATLPKCAQVEIDGVMML